MAKINKRGRKGTPRARRKALAFKKTVVHRKSGDASLKQQLAEARAQQAATAAILKVIAGSPSDTQPVFDAIAESGMRVFGAWGVTVTRFDGRLIHLAAARGALPDTEQFLRKLYPLEPGPETISSRCIESRKMHHVPDVLTDPSARVRDITRTRGIRAVLGVPMLREGEPIGAINVTRREPGAFAQSEIELLHTFADQAVIAIENVRLFNETKEALEQQTASNEILGVISSSPTDLRPVFDAILASATRLCDAHLGVLNLYDGENYRTVAQRGGKEEFVKWVFGRGSFKPVGLMARMIAERQAFHHADMRDSDAYRAGIVHSVKFADLGGARSYLTVPLIKDGEVIGSIAIYRQEVKSFSEKQKAVVKTFADQAVIAIENVRLFRELEARNRDVTDALEQQTATAEILRVISSSPTNVQPVFDAIVRSGLKIFAGTSIGISVADGDSQLVVASGGNVSQIPLGIRVPRSRESATGTAVVERTVVNIKDTEAPDAPLSARDNGRALGFRAIAAVPLLREGEAIGAISLLQKDTGGLSDKQVTLLRSFADQAVIAIENVRLFNETKEALERQTATAEILRVISSTPTDTQPVFDAIVNSTQRLIAGKSSGLLLRRESHFVVAGYSGPAMADLPDQVLTVPLDREKNFPSRAILDAEVVHVPDFGADDVPEHERVVGKAFGIRSGLLVPLLRDGEGIGALAVTRATTGRYNEKEIALLQSFADQAVIAIENVRLFNETKEALERQTATAEILKVIASSPSDVQPVFDAILRSAVNLCGAEIAAVFPYDGKLVHLGATHNWSEEALEYFSGVYPAPPSPALMSGRTILAKSIVKIVDAAADGHYDPNSAATGHWRRMLGVPMLREGQPLGALVVCWREPGETPQRQVDLLQTFADQAVIAIENVRLFNETKEALERQTATGEILSVISRSQTDVQPVFDTIAKNALRLCDGMFSAVGRFDGTIIQLAAYHNVELEDAEEIRKAWPMTLESKTVTARAVRERAVVQIPDIGAEAQYGLGDLAKSMNYRSVLCVPMLRDGTPVGAITIARALPGEFPAEQVALLKTFADQAVIAIENARLFNETKESLEQQKASAEILSVISNSVADTKPVFAKILDSCAHLFGSDETAVLLVDEQDQVTLGAYVGKQHDAVAATFPAPLAKSPAGHAIRERRVVHYADVVNAPQLTRAVRRVAELAGYQAMAYAPMLWNDKGIGAIGVSRLRGGFADKELAMLQTFADQAVIAIQNVRLFKELQAQTEALTKSVGQLTALGEVGQAISSTLDLEKVLQTIVSRAVQLTGLDGGSMYEYDEAAGEFTLQAAENIEAELEQAVREVPVKKGEGAIGQTAITLEPAQVADILDASYQSSRKELLLKSGYRGVLAVPLLREGHMLGALQVFRREPGEFAPEIVELLKTFASQSAMAIQNARLFREIAEKGKQLEVASQHKSNFLASMSHELRTPLNAILGFNEMILGQVYGEVPVDMQEPLTDIQTSGKHLLRLINNVLDLAKIEAGRMELSLQDYSVHDTVASVHSTLRPLAAEKGLEFLANVPNDVPLAYGDGGRIAQCLMNLAGNSLKFTKAGKVEISVATRGDILVYKVSDTGIGIAPDKIDSLFTEFKQTDATIASEYGGTGLGLSISKKFIEMHGGRIWIESELGKGSAFIIEVPLRVKTT